MRPSAQLCSTRASEVQPGALLPWNPRALLGPQGGTWTGTVMQRAEVARGGVVLFPVEEGMVAVGREPGQGWWGSCRRQLEPRHREF